MTKIFKYLLTVPLLILILQWNVDARVNTSTKTGLVYLRSFNLKFIVKKISDQKESTLQSAHSGLAYEYETSEGSLFSYFFRGGIMDRNTNTTLFSGDIRESVVREEIFILEAGMRSTLNDRSTWGFYPFAGFNLSYFNINSTIQNLRFNETGLSDNDGFPSINKGISTSLFSPSVTIGLNYNFRYSGIRLMLNIYPEYMTLSGSLDDNYNYAFKFNGYLLGIGFVAFF